MVQYAPNYVAYGCIAIKEKLASPQHVLVGVSIDVLNAMSYLVPKKCR